MESEVKANGDNDISKQQEQIDEVSFLDAEMQKILDRAYHRQEDDANDARMYGDLLARKYELLGQHWLITSVAEDTARAFRYAGIKSAEWINDILPDKYKNPNRVLGHEQEQSSSSLHDIRVNDYKNLLDQIEKYAIQQADKETERDLFEEFEKRTRHILEDCDKKKIALVNQQGDSANESDNDKQVSIIKPKAMYTICVEKAHQVGDAFHDYAKVLEEFPPELEVDQQKIAQGLDIFIEMLKPSLDLKWTKCWGKWFRVEQDRLDYGKHAAAVREYTDTNLCPTCTDLHDDPREKIEPVLVELVRNPESSTGWACPQCGCENGLKRDMTREQVGDKSKQVLRFARKIADNFEGFALGLYFHHIEFLEKRAGSRKIRLAPTLSSKA